MTEQHKAFMEELGELLKKHNAELCIDDEPDCTPTFEIYFDGDVSSTLDIAWSSITSNDCTDFIKEHEE